MNRMVETAESRQHKDSALKRATLPALALVGMGAISLLLLRSRDGERGAASPTAGLTELTPRDSEGERVINPALAPADNFRVEAPEASAELVDSQLLSLTPQPEPSAVELFERLTSFIAKRERIPDLLQKTLNASVFQSDELITSDKDLENLKILLDPEQLMQHRFERLALHLYEEVIDYARKRDSIMMSASPGAQVASQVASEEGQVFVALCAAFSKERERGETPLGTFFRSLINWHVGTGIETNDDGSFSAGLSREELAPLSNLIARSQSGDDLKVGELLSSVMEAERRFPGLVGDITYQREIQSWDASFGEPTHKALELYQKWPAFGGTAQEFYLEEIQLALNSGIGKGDLGVEPQTKSLSISEMEEKFAALMVMSDFLRDHPIDPTLIANSISPELFFPLSVTVPDEEGNEFKVPLDFGAPLVGIVSSYAGEAGDRLLRAVYQDERASPELRAEIDKQRVSKGRLEVTEIEERIKKGEPLMILTPLIETVSQYNPKVLTLLKDKLSDPDTSEMDRVTLLLRMGKEGCLECVPQLEQALSNGAPIAQRAALVARALIQQDLVPVLERYILDSHSIHRQLGLTLLASQPNSDQVMASLSRICEGEDLPLARQSLLFYALLSPESAHTNLQTAQGNWGKFASDQELLSLIDRASQQKDQQFVDLLWEAYEGERTHSRTLDQRVYNFMDRDEARVVRKAREIFKVDP